MQVLEKYAALENSFSAEANLYGHIQKGPGYHTRVPEGTWVHGTRENLNHAFSLLYSPLPEHHERAQTIIARILELQDRDPTSATYGIWSWMVEEPLSQMSPPDWNWADFLGLILARIVVVHGEKLDAELKQRCLDGLEHAAHSIFRRNVLASYTNIAIKGACVSVAAGELLGQPWLVRYGVRRLHTVLEAVAENGGFQEYNSPTYTRLVMSICESSLYILETPAARDAIEAILLTEWEMIAAHFHPPTGQLCGPQSRAYSNFLGADWHNFLGHRTGLWPVNMDDVEPEALPCPPHLVEAFRTVPPEMGEQTIQHTLRPRGRPITAQVWREGDACLGSVCDGNTWNQCRPLLGYWRGPSSEPVVLRLSVLHDGKDFATGYVWNSQRGPRILSALGFLTDGGDFHLHFDKSPTGHFPVRVLTVRLEVGSENATSRVAARQSGAGRFELSAGEWRAVVHLGSAKIGGRELKWGLREEAGAACLEGEISFDEGEFQVNMLGDILVLLGLEVLPHGTAPAEEAPQIVEQGVLDYTAEWRTPQGSLLLTAPKVAIPQERGGSYGSRVPKQN